MPRLSFWDIEFRATVSPRPYLAKHHPHAAPVSTCARLPSGRAEPWRTGEVIFRASVLVASREVTFLTHHGGGDADRSAVGRAQTGIQPSSQTRYRTSQMVVVNDPKYLCNILDQFLYEIVCPCFARSPHSRGSIYAPLRRVCHDQVGIENRQTSWSETSHTPCRKWPPSGVQAQNMDRPSKRQFPCVPASATEAPSSVLPNLTPHSMAPAYNRRGPRIDFRDVFRKHPSSMMS